jgi:hypothetical protein
VKADGLTILKERGKRPFFIVEISQTMHEVKDVGQA